MAYKDDLDYNPFYKALQNSLHPKFEEAQKKCWVICIPKVNSTKITRFTEQFAEVHILKPSPFFKGTYMSTDRDGRMSIEIEDGYIVTPTESIKILSEELAYNENYKKYSILIIEKPLDPQFQKKVTPSSKEHCTQKMAVIEPVKFLLSFPCHKSVLHMLDKRLAHFNKTYMVLPDFLTDVQTKLNEIYWNYRQQFLECHNTYLEENDPPLALEISLACESYITTKVHSKVFAVIQNKYFNKDLFLYNKLDSLSKQGLDSSKMKLPLEFQCPLTKAILIMKELDTRVGSSSKMLCIKESIDAITEDINQFTKPQFPYYKREPLPLTSDNLISLMIIALVEAKPKHLASCLFYIQTYCPELQTIENFSLVTFQASLEYIKTDDFAFLKSPLNGFHSVQKETNKTSSSTSKLGAASKIKRPNLSKPLSPFDKKLEKITKKIVATSQEFQVNNNEDSSTKSSTSSKPVITKSSSDQELGDFLTRLKISNYGMSFGKQS